MRSESLNDIWYYFVQKCGYFWDFKGRGLPSSPSWLDGCQADKCKGPRGTPDIASGGDMNAATFLML